MLLDGSTTWPLQVLTWWTRFVVESSSCLQVRMIEGFLLPCEIEWAEKKECRDLCVTSKLILYDIVLHNYNWCLEVAITSWGPNFELGFYMEEQDVKKKKLEWHGDSLRISSLDLVAVSYLSLNAESLVQTWRGASLAGDNSLARLLLVHDMLEETGLVKKMHFI